MQFSTDSLFLDAELTQLMVAILTVVYGHVKVFKTVCACLLRRRLHTILNPYLIGH